MSIIGQMAHLRFGTTKVKTGCLTCRERRVKCDEKWYEGSCQRCSRLSRSCAGPPLSSESSNFILYTANAPNASFGQERQVEYDICHSRSQASTSVVQGNLSHSSIDPFDSLPIESTSGVRYAVNYCETLLPVDFVLHTLLNLYIQCFTYTFLV